MRITCPSCDATYDVPDAMLAGGPRKVRCARCGTEWVPTPMSAAPLALEDSDPEPPPYAPLPALPPPSPDMPGRTEPRLHPLRPRPEPVREPAFADDEDEEEPPRSGGARAVLAWGLSLLVLAALALAAVQWRAQVMEAWPPSERVYAALGLR
jgi:predicted Zn finger-like uncharacterized protein